jgi:hypothetical protein
MRVVAVAAALLSVSLSGCIADGRIPRDALEFRPQTLQRRQIQTRIFDTADEELILAASAGLIQDLGFSIDESETDLGVIVGSKRRDARETSQIIRSVLTTLAGAAMSFGTYWAASDPIDDVQLIRASLVSAPAGDSGRRMAVRITFQRIVWDTDGEVSRREAIDDPAIYEDFFNALSHSVFLEAHRI